MLKYKQWFQKFWQYRSTFFPAKIGSDIHIMLSLLPNFSDLCFPFTKLTHGL